MDADAPAWNAAARERQLLSRNQRRRAHLTLRFFAPRDIGEPQFSLVTDSPDSGWRVVGGEILTQGQYGRK